MELVLSVSVNVALVKHLFNLFLLPRSHRGKRYRMELALSASGNRLCAARAHRGNATGKNWYWLCRASRLDSMGAGGAFVVGWYVGMGEVQRGRALGVVQRELVSCGLHLLQAKKSPASQLTGGASGREFRPGLSSGRQFRQNFHPPSRPRTGQNLPGCRSYSAATNFSFNSIMAVNLPYSAFNFPIACVNCHAIAAVLIILLFSKV